MTKPTPIKLSSEHSDVTYKVGQAAWFFHGNHQGKMTEGKVVHKFKLDGQQLYVLEYDTGIDPCYVVREWESMSPAPDQPIGMWKMVVAISKQMKKSEAALARLAELDEEPLAGLAKLDEAALARQAELDGDYNGE